ncbi:MAG: vWA domain-containing protein [Thermomicrobiales bacterium]
MTADTAVQGFDKFLDDLVLNHAALEHDVDPGLAAAARSLHAAAGAHAPDPAFARNSRASVVTQPCPEARHDGRKSVTSAVVHGIPRLLPLARRAMITRQAAIAALVVIFAVGFAAGGFRLLPSGLGNDEPTHLAAPSIPSPEQTSAAILFIVDRSGSMSYDPLGQTSKLEWEKETIRRALDELPVGDQIGVLAFNDQYMVAVPMTRIERDADRAAVRQDIDAITADGGSELAPALRAGLDMLNQTNAATKHAVLLTDGKSRDDVPSELQRIVQAAYADGIVLSVIAIGDDADTALLQFLAETGGGRYHHITSPADVPIVTVEGTGIGLSLPATPVASPVPATPTNP